MGDSDKFDLAIGALDTVATGGAAGLAKGLAAQVCDALGIQSTEATMKAGIDQMFAEELEAVVAHWRQHGAWYDEHPDEARPTPVDVAAVIAEAIGVYRRTADPGKRRLLHNAMVNAFDPEQYKAGLTRRLLRVLDDLEYGDVVLLRRLHEVLTTGSALRLDELQIFHGQDDHDHVIVLIRVGLALPLPTDAGRQTPAPSNPPTVSPYLTSRERIRVTALGARLVRLLREPPPPDPALPAPE